MGFTAFSTNLPANTPWLAAGWFIPEKLGSGIQESDSHYHMKYTHKQSERIDKPKRHDIPPRIQAQIESACSWYYQLYYPGEEVAQPARSTSLYF